jgi:hypothetical protein
MQPISHKNYIEETELRTFLDQFTNGTALDDSLVGFVFGKYFQIKKEPTITSMKNSSCCNLKSPRCISS